MRKKLLNQEHEALSLLGKTALSRKTAELYFNSFASNISLNSFKCYYFQSWYRPPEATELRRTP